MHTANCHRIWRCSSSDDKKHAHYGSRGRETKERPVYLLRVRKGGPKLHEVQDVAGGIQMKMDGPARHMRSKPSMARLAGFLSDELRRPVVDQTGLKGTFDIALDFTLDDSAPQNGTDLRGAIEN